MRLVPTADQLDSASQQLIAFADAMAARAGLMQSGTQHLSTVASNIPGWWIGRRADTTTAEVNAFVSRFGGTVSTLESIAGRARWASGRAAVHAAEIRRLETRRIDAYAAPRISEVGGFRPVVDQEALRATLRRIERQLDQVDLDWAADASDGGRFINDMLASISSVASTGIVPRRMGFGGSATMLAGLLGLAPGLHPPSGDRTPAEVAAWWDSLDGSERLAMLTLMPGVIGNLDGIPFDDRVTANRTYVNGLLAAEGPNGPIRERFADFLVNGKLDINRRIIAIDLGSDGRVAELFGDVSSGSATR